MLVWGFEELQDLYLESSHKTWCVDTRQFSCWFQTRG